MKRAVLVVFAGLGLSACQSSCGYDARSAGRVAQSLGDTGVKLGKVRIPGQRTALVFAPEDCDTLDGAVEKTNINTWTPRGSVNHLRGHVTFECRHTSGTGLVTGNLVFSNCH